MVKSKKIKVVKKETVEEKPVEKSEEENVFDNLVMAASEVETLKFRALDAELRNDLQGIRLIDFEIKKLELDFNNAVRAKRANREGIIAAYDSKKREYDELVLSIAKKYNLDSKRMSIDTDTGVLRDLREDQGNPRVTQNLSKAN